MMTNHNLIYLYLVCLFLAGCSNGSQKTLDVEADRNIKSIIKSDNWDNLRFEIHEVPCFGRNVLEADLSIIGSDIKSQIIYRKNHSIWFENKPDSILEAAKMDIGKEFDRVLLDTTFFADKQQLIKDISNAYDNKKSTGFIAGYNLEVNLISGKDTFKCDAINPGFINIFKR
jgi:hypothetical protein